MIAIRGKDDKMRYFNSYTNNMTGNVNYFCMHCGYQFFSNDNTLLSRLEEHKCNYIKSLFRRLYNLFSKNKD